ncbi:MAG: GNAT family N-acetyltransferase [Clostridia bacterium]|nr:GNAT family N-acetyltransferase [Clostridia bacterium]
MIKKLNTENISHLNIANQPFQIIGKLKLSYSGGVWYSEEVLSETVTEKQYPNYDGANAEDYISSADRIAYLAYDGDTCVGQILLAKTWNGYAHIEDISVAADYRGQGIGTTLLAKAEEWAKEQRFFALSLECQDNNVLASRFYKKNGFHIGGVNTDLYRMLGKPFADEVAVFWYKHVR